MTAATTDYLAELIYGRLEKFPNRDGMTFTGHCEEQKLVLECITGATNAFLLNKPDSLELATLWIDDPGHWLRYQKRWKKRGLLLDVKERQHLPIICITIKDVTLTGNTMGAIENWCDTYSSDKPFYFGHGEHDKTFSNSNIDDIYRSTVTHVDSVTGRMMRGNYIDMESISDEEDDAEPPDHYCISAFGWYTLEPESDDSIVRLEVPSLQEAKRYPEAYYDMAEAVEAHHHARSDIEEWRKLRRSLSASPTSLILSPSTQAGASTATSQPMGPRPRSLTMARAVRLPLTGSP